MRDLVGVADHLDADPLDDADRRRQLAHPLGHAGPGRDGWSPVTSATSRSR